MPSPSFRTATIEDLQALLGLVREFEEHEGCVRGDAHDRGALEPLLNDPTLGRVPVAEVDGELVGYAILTWGWGLESGGKEALVDEFYVARRGQGIGSQLFEHALRLAREVGAKTLFLETEGPNEDARRLYRRHGLTEQDSIWMSTDL